MFKKLGAWIASIFRHELEALEALLASEFSRRDQKAASDIEALKAHVTQELAVARKELADAKQELIGFTSTAAVNLRDDIKGARAAARADADNLVQHITKKADEPIIDLRNFIRDEIMKRYDTLVKDSAEAARLLDSTKICMAICDYCKLASRRFSVSRIDGKMVCAACVAKGQR